MTATRGPSGAAPLPPADLARRALTIATLKTGAPLYRVHRTTLHPVFFGPGAGRPPTHRFDPASGAFGVLYAAPGPDAALIETLLRNPARMTVAWSEIAPRSLSVLTAARDLQLVDATGANLSRLGTTAALATGPYAPCAAWADALFAHPARPDGILYGARHNPAERCLALFERDDISLSVTATHPLPRILAQVGRVLDRHGKSVFGCP